MGPDELVGYVEGARVMSDWFPFIEYEGPRHVYEGASVNEILFNFMELRCDPAKYVVSWLDGDEETQQQMIDQQNNAWRLMHEGVIAQNLMRLEESRTKLEQAVNQAHWLGDARFYLSRTYFLLSERVPVQRADRQALQQTYTYLTRALELNPRSRSALGKMGSVCDRLGLREEANGYWERLLSVLPPYAAAAEAVRTRLER
jgi:tetratricopeptide (TPR) repeat protein